MNTALQQDSTFYVRLTRFFRAFAPGRKLGNRLALALIFAAVASGLATYMALTEVPPFGNDTSTVIWLLNLDLVILALLVSLIARRVAGLVSGRRRGLAGSHLHVKLILIFSMMAAVPAIIMTVFSAVFLYFGVESWFGDQIRTAVEKSQAVAEAYLSEHQQVIRADIMAMANDMDRQSSLLLDNPGAFEKIFKTQLMLRNLSEGIIFDGSGRIISGGGMTFALTFETLPADVLTRTDSGEVVVMTGGMDDRVRALVKLSNFYDSYLYVGRMVDATVLGHLAATKKAVEAYENLDIQHNALQVRITMIFVVVGLLLLFVAIWIGLNFARQLSLPISALITAADRVRSGDMTARVPDFERRDEFDVLARAFNRMTSQIEEQRNELISANRQLDRRRRFTEAVLAGVSSGIVGTDRAGLITIVNGPAAVLFDCTEQDLLGRTIEDVLPSLKDLMAEARQKPEKIAQFQMPYEGRDGVRRIFLVRAALERVGEEEAGAVLTFDDITELQSAQRKAAWADVARRIAHEIKNPLTPIQLSAERLKRKYLKQIHEDPEIFAQCTDTIIHHVNDIGRMVNEFSAFARMPLPVMKREDLLRHTRDLISLRQQAHPEISFSLMGADPQSDKILSYFDSQQIRQAFTNIIQNAVDSIETRMERDRMEGRAPKPGQIGIFIQSRGNEIVLAVSDNGLGLPKGQDPESLTEPYVTHREKGTGLGLAIVKKIMEDHKGRLSFGVPDWLKNAHEWKDLGGATVTLSMPAERQQQDDKAA